MSFPKRWVSNKLSRNRAGDHPVTTGSTVGDVPQSPSGSGEAPACLSSGSGGGDSDQGHRRGHSHGQQLPSPLRQTSPPNLGGHPKKAWEWHYKSFLSRRGLVPPGGGKHGGGGDPPGISQVRSLSSSDVRASLGTVGHRSASPKSLAGRKKSPMSSSGLDELDAPRTPTRVPPPSKNGRGASYHPSSAPVNRSQSDPTASSSNEALAGADLIAAIPPPPVLASSSSSTFPAAAVSPPTTTLGRSSTVGASLGPTSPTSPVAKIPLAFKRRSSPLGHFGPRPQPNPELSASTSDTSVRGGSLFKSIFKHGGSGGGSKSDDLGGANGRMTSGPPPPPYAPIRNKAKSYDSLDATVRKGNEVAYGRAAGGQHGHAAAGGSQQQAHHPGYPGQSGKARSWDSKLHATGPSAQLAPAPYVVSPGEPPHAIAGGPARRGGKSGPGAGAGIGPSGTATPMQQPPPPSSSLSSSVHRSKEMKKAFTEFHNSVHYGADTTSPYLGDDPSIRQSNYFAVRYGDGAAAGGGGAGAGVALSSSIPSQMGPSPHTLSPVTEGAAHITSSILKPMAGVETWIKDRRYLIGPAVLSMCPLEVLSSLPVEGKRRGSLSDSIGGTRASEGIANIRCDTEKDNPALTDEKDATIAVAPLDHCNASPTAYGRMHMGKVSVSRGITSEGYGSWSDTVLVLRHNYLFEYEQGSGLNERPRGFAFLQNAVSYADGDSPTDFRLNFYESPCAGGDMRKLLIRVETQEERDHWVFSLMEAARLSIEDFYEYDGSDEGLEFGRGRYATVRPARRKFGGLRSSQSVGGLSRNLDETNASIGVAGSLKHANSVASSRLAAAVSNANYDCALKIINKNEFWSRVVNGRERADTLVRETAVQASLTAQMGHLPTFLRLRNFFETIDNIVLELELLQGTDLFHHVSSMGVLDENEAAHVMRDILTCIDAMQRIGIAHRDVKPANVLMCHAEAGDGVAVKLGDFGMATFVGIDNLVRGRCGTPGYVAPEILRSGGSCGYGNNVDVFSAGVTLYVLLCGYEPFYGECDSELIASNRQAAVEFPDSDWDGGEFAWNETLFFQFGRMQYQ